MKCPNMYMTSCVHDHIGANGSNIIYAYPDLYSNFYKFKYVLCGYGFGKRYKYEDVYMSI